MTNGNRSLAGQLKIRTRSVVDVYPEVSSTAYGIRATIYMVTSLNATEISNWN
jgi:hypothetical protein